MTNDQPRKSEPLALVLGAGATRACSFVEPKTFSCIPPLDGDFFTQLQRVPDPKHRALIDELMRNIVEIFGKNFSLTLETAFTTIEHTSRMLAATKSPGSTKHKEELKQTRDRLMEAISIVLEASLVGRGETGRATHDAQDCMHHKAFVERVLERGDTVVSFNYDCVIDYALRLHGASKWNAKYGYGFKLGPHGADLTGHENWSSDRKIDAKETIHVHKLHGSLHFQFSEPTDRSRTKSRPSVSLKQRPYTKQLGTPRFSIIPPESNKTYDKGLFAGLWRNAAQRLLAAKHVVVIGYSFPATDLHAASLFRTSLKRSGLKSLVIVNPDRAARRRARDVMQNGLSPTTRAVSFDSVAEFLATDKSVWRG
jgi:hypothetical protein